MDGDNVLKYGGLAAFGFALYAMGSLNYLVIILISFLIWIVTGGHHTIYLLYHTLGRDLRYVSKCDILCFRIIHNSF